MISAVQEILDLIEEYELQLDKEELRELIDKLTSMMESVEEDE